MIDSEGYRANIGIILLNDEGKVFLGKRVGQDAWQFPQGGLEEDETVEAAMFRELHEEVGLHPHQVQIIGRTEDWLRYDIPDHLIRKRSQPRCIGQKQIWYLLKLEVPDSEISLFECDPIEFDGWQWVDYWSPSDKVIEFKRGVYEQALKELSNFIK